MRIAFFVEGFPSLSETFVLNQITGLIERGHEVDIYADRQGDRSKMHIDVEKYRLLEHTYYMEIPQNRFWRFWKAFWLLLTNFWINPVAIFKSLNIFKYKRWARSLTLFYAVVYLLNKQTSYDIIHCHFGPYGLKGALLREIGVIQGNLVTTFHGYDVSSIPQRFGHQIYQPLFDAGEVFLPISSQMKNQLIKLGCNEKKITVHRVGIDTQKFSFSPRQLCDGSPIQIITIARLVEKKGVEYAIRAIAKLTDTRTKIQYNVIGDGPLKQNLEQLIQELDLGETVKLLGWKQQQDVLNFLNSAVILLAPSVTGTNADQEGIPVVLMEAMARGLSVISTLHSGIPELVKDGISGYLVPERDVDKLANKLDYLISHPEIWSGMGQAGRKQIEEHYDINKLNDKLVNIYQELLARKIANV